ncbi:MAG: hypothetical protein PF501_18910 [Salinisphaera sp.]|jgi:hypothetical protein|nr:hypothetical protein [Salinisphaera sp.]
MSRSGYSDDIDDRWAFIRYRGAVASAIRGERGQRLLRDLIDALEAMPQKRLIADELENATGEVCALGAIGKRRGVEMAGLNPDASKRVAGTFDIAEALAREIVFENDEICDRKFDPATRGCRDFTPEERWQHIYRWAQSKLRLESQSA